MGEYAHPTWLHFAFMPRTARAVAPGRIYHVLNRGNGRQDLFHKPADFDAFRRVLAEGLGRYPVDLLAYCLMTNHGSTELAEVWSCGPAPTPRHWGG